MANHSSQDKNNFQMQDTKEAVQYERNACTTSPWDQMIYDV